MLQPNARCKTKRSDASSHVLLNIQAPPEIAPHRLSPITVQTSKSSPSPHHLLLTPYLTHPSPFSSLRHTYIRFVRRFDTLKLFFHRRLPTKVSLFFLFFCYLVSWPLHNQGRVDSCVLSLVTTTLTLASAVVTRTLTLASVLVMEYHPCLQSPLYLAYTDYLLSKVFDV